MASQTSPVWFITGCTSGFGRDIALEALSRGWRVVATGRGKARLADLLDKGGENILTLDLDVTKLDQIHAAVKAATDNFGAIDVLVNNAGYGYYSAAEEGEEADLRAEYDVNVFGLFAMTRAVLPGMRARKRGHIINMSSVAGLVGFPGAAYYASSKHAVEGFSDSLLTEVGPLGLKVTCVEPGPFRTDFTGRSIHQNLPKADDYAETARKRMVTMKNYDGQQPGDPLRAAKAVVALGEQSDPPRHLVLGAFGHEAVTSALKRRLAEIEGLREIALGADYPNA